MSGDATQFGCRRGEAMWFFDRYTSVGPPTVYGELLGTAQSVLSIWDPWFNESDQAILQTVRDGLTVMLLFVASSHAEVQTKFKDRIQRTQARYPRLAVRARYCCTDEGRGFHDRFLLIDRTRVFAVGASVGHHCQDLNSTGIIELASATDRALVMALFDEYWARGKTL